MHFCCSAFRLVSALIVRPALDLLCPLLTSPRYSAPIAQRPASLFRSTGEISRGKTRYRPCLDAGFTTGIPTAEGGLRSHVPARPSCLTPHIRSLLFASSLRLTLRAALRAFKIVPYDFVIAPQFRIGRTDRPRLAATPLSFSWPSALRIPGHRTYTGSNAPCPAHTRP